MIKYLLKYRTLSVTILVLTPLLLWFVYSELGQFTIADEIPASQDYCETVKVIKTETGKDALSDLFKLKVDKSFGYDNIDEPRIHNTSYSHLEIEHFHSPQKTNKIYLFNNTFLI
ncbi:MAG: hypothetical protein SCALA702_01920 [Melioribacteraceae bacterium]|jgi:hypothetical protein|nr:MAG: hypothetical protein SCALA702_01920 [Melioribacteraceae bacterium]